MRNLHEPLPDTVEVSGREYEISTDFRSWLKYEALLGDREVSEADKLSIMLHFFTDEIPNTADAAVAALAAFFALGETTAHKGGNATPGARREPVTDLSDDAALIYAAFMQTYKIDLMNIPHLHWWAFRALLDGLPEGTQYSKIVGIRATDIKELPKSMRKHYTKMKKVVGLRIARQPKYTTLEERDEAMKQHAKQVAART